MFYKIKRAFLWFYFIGITILWFLILFFSVKTADYNFIQLGWLLFTGLGIVALHSYLDSFYVGHRHFWKVCLLLVISFYLMTSSFSVLGALGGLLIMFPTVYAFYYLGFRDDEHALCCLIRNEYLDRFDQRMAELKEERSYLDKSPGEKAALNLYCFFLRWRIN